MSSDRLSRHYQHGALMRLAARHQNSAVVLRRQPTDERNGDSGPKLIPVYPTVKIRAGLGRSGKNVAKVNSTWTDTECNFNHADYAESEESSSIFNYDYEDHNGIKTLGRHYGYTNDRTFSHNAEMRDEEDEHEHRESQSRAMSSSTKSTSKLSRTQEALLHLGQKSKSRTGKLVKETSIEKSKASTKSNIISRKLKTLSCRNGVEVIESNRAKAGRDSNYAINEEFSQSREDSIGTFNREDYIRPNESEIYNSPRNRADLSLYKYYAGSSKKDTEDDEVDEINELVSRLRKGLRAKSG